MKNRLRRAHHSFPLSLSLLLLAAGSAATGCGAEDLQPPPAEEAVVDAAEALTTTLNPVADTHVRDGSFANTNYGTATTLEVKRSTSSYNREAYLKFDVGTSTEKVHSAKLRVYGGNTEAGTVPVVARLLPDGAFDESTITYGSKAQSTPVELGRVKVSSTTNAWYELDVTGIVRERMRNGGSSIEFSLQSTAQTNALTRFNSRQATSNKPELVITTATALFVVGNTTLNNGDSAVKTRLQQLGYTVTTKSAPSATSTDATGKSLVVVSSTVTSADVNTKFRDVTVPVVLWESAILDDMMMTGTASTEFGTTTTQTQVAVSSSSHALAGGREGSPSVASSGPLTWGKPGSSAQKIATLSGDSSKWTVFGYEQGATMVGMNAPARRVSLFLGDSTAASHTTSGWALFDAAVTWASGAKPFRTKKVRVLNYDPILEAHGNKRVSKYYQDLGYLWFDGSVLAQQFVQNLARASGDYVQYQIVSTTTINDWPPYVGGAPYTDQDYLVDYERPWCDSHDDCLSNRCFFYDEEDPDGGGDCLQNLRNGEADYAAIMSSYGIETAIANGTYDEVFIAGPPGLGFSESRMVGPNAYYVNGGAMVRPGKNYFIEYMDSSRYISQFEHAYVHRLEWIMRKVYGEKYGLDGSGQLSNWNSDAYGPPCYWITTNPTCAVQRKHHWDNFTMVDGVAANMRARGDANAFAGVGTAHFVPHAQSKSADNYNHGGFWDELGNRVLLAPVASTADDWLYNFPNLTGETRQIAMTEWFWPDGTGDVEEGGFMQWFNNHIPRVPGRHSDGVLYNWWEYIVNINAYPEALE